MELMSRSTRCATPRRSASPPVIPFSPTRAPDKKDAPRIDHRTPDRRPAPDRRREPVPDGPTPTVAWLLQRTGRPPHRGVADRRPLPQPPDLPNMVAVATDARRRRAPALLGEARHPDGDHRQRRVSGHRVKQGAVVGEVARRDVVIFGDGSPPPAPWCRRWTRSKAAGARWRPCRRDPRRAVRTGDPTACARRRRFGGGHQHRRPKGQAPRQAPVLNVAPLFAAAIGAHPQRPGMGACSRAEAKRSVEHEIPIPAAAQGGGVVASSSRRLASMEATMASSARSFVIMPKGSSISLERLEARRRCGTKPTTSGVINRSCPQTEGQQHAMR